MKNLSLEEQPTPPHSKMVANLYDTVFAHDESAVAGVRSRLLTWDREALDDTRPTFFSHEQMLTGLHRRVPANVRYGLLYESQAIIPDVYRDVERVISEYQLVFTHSSRLLNTFPNTRWIPGSGVWVGGTHVGGRPGLQEKTRNCSILTSNKLKAPLHRRRYVIAQRLRLANKGVDCFIQKFNDAKRISVLDTLVPYRYSICVENFVDDTYFTEKLLNCFATGTVPIYLGATGIGRFFNPQGIITFSSYSDLVRRVLPILGEDDYTLRRGAIEENLSLSREYGSLEDFIVTHYLGA